MPDITIAGATFAGVPSITVPKSGGGTASFVYEDGSKSITENGTHDVSGFAEAVVNVSGGGSATIEALTVTQNGTYTAPSGVDGYSPVTVNVSGGGGNYTLIASQDFTVSTTTTSARSIGDLECIWDADSIIYVRVRDKAGKRNGYFYGTDTWFINYLDANGDSASNLTAAGRIIHKYDNDVWSQIIQTTGYGVYGHSIAHSTTGHIMRIYARYNANYTLTIDGTYSVEVYKLTYPDNVSPFDAE